MEALTQFQSFIQSGSQYKDDAAHIRRTMDQFYERTERLKHSMSGIADSIGTITKAIDEGVGGFMVGKMTDRGDACQKFKISA